VIDRSGATAADDIESSTMNNIALSQLLDEMNTETPPESQAQPLDSISSHPSCQLHCRCVTAMHQVAGICIEHFMISAEDERWLSNIAGKLVVCNVM